MGNQGNESLIFSFDHFFQKSYGFFKGIKFQGLDNLPLETVQDLAVKKAFELEGSF
jgi:hypothetical protein